MKTRLFILISFFIIITIFYSCILWGNTTAPLIPIGIGDVDQIYYLNDNTVLTYKMGENSDPAFLEVRNYTNAINPEILLSVECNNYRIFTERYIYIVTTDNTGLVYDLTDVNLPQETSPIQGLADTVYYTNDSDEFFIIDVSDPFNTVTLSIITIASIHDFVVKDDILYIASEYGLIIFDINDKSNPEVIGKLNGYLPQYNNRDIYILGDIVYISNWDNLAVVTIDVADKTNPVKMEEIVIERFFQTSAMVGFGESIYMIVYNDAYFVIGNNSQSLFHYDISNEGIPVLIEGNIGRFKNITGMVATEDYLMTSGNVLLMQRPKVE